MCHLKFAADEIKSLTLPAGDNFSHLLITFASSLNTDQALQNVVPDLDQTV